MRIMTTQQTSQTLSEEYKLNTPLSSKMKAKAVASLIPSLEAVIVEKTLSKLHLDYQCNPQLLVRSDLAMYAKHF